MLHKRVIEVQEAGNSIVGYKTSEEDQKYKKIKQEIESASSEMDDYLRVIDPILNFSTDVELIRSSKSEIVQNALEIVRSILKSQSATIFLFSKNGDLERFGIDAIDKDGQSVNNDWYLDERYTIGETFTGKAADPKGSKYAKIQSTTDLFNADFGERSKSEYLNKFGTLKSSIAVPLNGRNKTYGVLRIINKDNGTEVFTEDDVRYLVFLAVHIANALSNFRRDVQVRVFKHLSRLLIQSAYNSFGRNSSLEEVYQQALDLLVKNPETAFKSGVLRVEGDNNHLEVVATSISDEVTEVRDNASVKIGTGLAGKVAQSGKRLILQKIHQPKQVKKFRNYKWIIDNKFESFGCFPLIAKEQIVGTLSLYTGYNYDFHPESIEFVQSVADLIASFVHGMQQEKIKQILQQEIVSGVISLTEMQPTRDMSFELTQPTQVKRVHQVNNQLKNRGILGAILSTKFNSNIKTFRYLPNLLIRFLVVGLVGSLLDLSGYVAKLDNPTLFFIVFLSALSIFVDEILNLVSMENSKVEETTKSSEVAATTQTQTPNINRKYLNDADSLLDLDLISRQVTNSINQLPDLISSDSKDELIMYLNLSCQSSAIVDQKFSFSIQLLTEQLEGNINAIAVSDLNSTQITCEIEVVLRDHNFKVEGGNTRILQVTPGKDHEEKFVVTPRYLGEQQIRVDFYQYDRCVGTVRQNILVLEN